MTIKEHLDILTNYRDNLIAFLKLNLNKTALHLDLTDPENRLTVTHRNIKRFLNEIELCNKYIHALYEWDLQFTYNSHSIVQSNSFAITTVDELLKKR